VKLIDFIFAARPMLLLPVWSVYLIACRFHYGGTQLDVGALMLLIAVSLVAVGAYFVNQIHDYQSDLMNKKLGFLQRGLINKSEMTAAYISVSSVGLILGLATDLRAGAVVIGLLLLGLFYSVPPFRLKDRPFWGGLANALGYGFLLPLAVPGYTMHLSASKASLPVYFFFAVLATYFLTVIPDREGDKKAGKRTIAALLSDRLVILTASAVLCLTLYVSYAFGHRDLLIVSLASVCLFLTALVAPGAKVILFACKMPILLLSILAGLYYPTYLIFMLVLLFSTRLYYRRRFGMRYPRCV
jgi:4-hydroxybenzoate polyprenyltransferase